MQWNACATPHCHRWTAFSNIWGTFPSNGHFIATAYLPVSHFSVLCWWGSLFLYCWICSVWSTCISASLGKTSRAPSISSAVHTLAFLLSNISATYSGLSQGKTAQAGLRLCPRYIQSSEHYLCHPSSWEQYRGCPQLQVLSPIAIQCWLSTSHSHFLWWQEINNKGQSTPWILPSTSRVRQGYYLILPLLYVQGLPRKSSWWFHFAHQNMQNPNCYLRRISCKLSFNIE